MSRAWFLPWTGAIVFGLAAESKVGSFVDTRAAAVDLAAGWTVISCGLLGWRIRRPSHTGPLLVACGFAWFVGNFGSPLNAVTSQWLPLAAIAAPLTHLYRGLLVHAIVSYPTGRVTAPLSRSTVVAGYAVAVQPWVWQSDALAALLGGGFGIAAWFVHREAARRGDQSGRIARASALAIAASLIGGSVTRTVAPAGDLESLASFAFEVVLMAVAVNLLIGLGSSASRRVTVTNLVVELGETRSGTLRDALANVLGDPDLQVGYRIPDREAYVDAEGHPIALPKGDAKRAVTSVERDGVPVAVLVHHPAVLEDRRLVGAIADAARLAASNAALQARVRAQVTELDASRRRLVAVGEEERRLLEQRLQDGALRRLQAIDGLLDAARATVQESPGATRRVDAASDALSATLTELRELADGLRPRSLSEHGLAGALAELAARSAVPVTLSVASGRWAPEVEATGYYVCAEALANVAKHARATRVVVTASEDEHSLRVVIEDDGIGGAGPDRGSGLRGLRDRVEALGGRFLVDSRSGRGTRLVATIPIGGEASQPGWSGQRTSYQVPPRAPRPS